MRPTLPPTTNPHPFLWVLLGNILRSQSPSPRTLASVSRADVAVVPAHGKPPMNTEFEFDYLLTSFSRIEKSLEATRQVVVMMFNAIIRIERQIKENTSDLREYGLE